MEHFETQLDVWNYLSIDGNAVAIPEEDVYYKFQDGKLCNFRKDNNEFVRGNSRSFHVVNVVPYEIVKVVEWWEVIPKTGVLCWINDYNPEVKHTVGLVFAKNDWGFKTITWDEDPDDSIYFQYATPLTEEEALELVFKQITDDAPLKVGDRVRIVKKITKEEGWDNYWCREMDPLIGGEGMVNSIWGGGYRVGSGGENYSYPRGSLLKLG